MNSLTEERKKWDTKWLIKKEKRGKKVWEPKKVIECQKFRTYSDILKMSL